MYQRGAAVFVVLILAFCAGCDKDASVSKETVQGPSGGPFVQSTSQAAPADSGVQNEQEATSANPRIAFEKIEFDFGEVEAGEKVEHVFRFRNTGEGLLKIEKVRSS